MRVLRIILVLLGLVTVAGCSAPQQVGAPALPLTTFIQAPIEPAPVEDMSGLPRSFTVYFDHDSDDIRASAMQVLWEAAQIANKLQPTIIRVNGFTDAVGNRSYNQKLSDRRAAAVAAQLVKLGIQVAVVEAKGRGSDQPAVKVKGAARKEARSRRVELTFDGGRVSATAPSRGMTTAPSIVPIAHPAPHALSVADTQRPAATLAFVKSECSAVTSDVPTPVQFACHEEVAGIMPPRQSATGPPVQIAAQNPDNFMVFVRKT